MLFRARITNFLEVSRNIVFSSVSGLFFFFFFKIYFFVFLLFNSLLWISAFAIRANIDTPRMALHYSVDVGIDYYGSSNNIFVLPFLGFLFFLINTLIFSIIRNNQDRRLIGHILFLTAVITNFALLIGLGSIYLINSR